MDFLFFSKWGYLQLWWASFCSDFSCYRAWLQAVAAVHGPSCCRACVESSWTRETVKPCISGQILSWDWSPVTSICCGGVPACSQLCVNGVRIVTPNDVSLSLLQLGLLSGGFQPPTRPGANRAISQRRIVIHIGWHICSYLLFYAVIHLWRLAKGFTDASHIMPQTLRYHWMCWIT